MMQMAQETRNGWRIVSVTGRADAESAHDLEAALLAAVNEHPAVALNCVGMSYISSAGLRAILQAARAAQTKGAEFAVCAPTPSVKKVFDMSGLHHVVNIQEGLSC